MSTFKVQVAEATEYVVDYVSEWAQQIATATGEGLAATHEALITSVKRDMHAQRPSVADGRTAQWRVRIQLAPNAEYASIQWDSDPERPVNEAGHMVCQGLAEVAYQVACAATAYHAGRDIEGLGEETLKHSLRSLRVSLSRLDGKAIWRPRYVLAATDAPREDAELGENPLKSLRNRSSLRQEWRAFVHVERVNEKVSPTS